MDESNNLMRFRLPPDQATIRQISFESLSLNACFNLDAELIVRPNDVFELINGQWYLFRNNVGTLIEGKWDRIE